MATATRTSKKQLVKISKTRTLHVHHAFFVNFFAVYRQHEHIFLKNSTPGEFAYIKHSDRVGIIALKFHRSRSHFLSDVFAAVAVVVS